MNMGVSMTVSILESYVIDVLMTIHPYLKSSQTLTHITPLHPPTPSMNTMHQLQGA